jgi:hypothetical protein
MENVMGEKSREYFAMWLSSHKPNFVVVHTQQSTHFFRSPSFINLKRRGKGYIFSLKADDLFLEIELDEEFNAFCLDKFKENAVSLMDMKNSVEVIEEYERNNK